MEVTGKTGVAVIGAGPAGLAAALAAVEAGVPASEVLLLERSDEVGGILNQCIHTGFGLQYFHEELSGPEYAGRFADSVKAAGINIMTGTTVLSIDKERRVTAVSPESGLFVLECGAIVAATGCRERPRGALRIPGTRPSGIFTAGTAQRYINIEGFSVGRRVVILGSGDIGLIMARRLTLEGAQVICVCEVQPCAGGLARNIAQCLDDFGIPLYLSRTVINIHGRDRVEGVTVADVDDSLSPIPGSEQYIPCDTLLLSVGLIPENELLTAAGIPLDPVTGGALTDMRMQTRAEGIFACGNALQVHDLVDNVTLEARIAGAAAADFALGHPMPGCPCRTLAGEGVRYVLPHFIPSDKTAGGVKLSFRVTSVERGASLTVSADGRVIRSQTRRIMRPGELQQVTLTASDAEALNGAQTLTVSVNGNN